MHVCVPVCECVLFCDYYIICVMHSFSYRRKYSRHHVWKPVFVLSEQNHWSGVRRPRAPPAPEDQQLWPWGNQGRPRGWSTTCRPLVKHTCRQASHPASQRADQVHPGETDSKVGKQQWNTTGDMWKYKVCGPLIVWAFECKKQHCTHTCVQCTSQFESLVNTMQNFRLCIFFLI